jgi:cell division protein FtsI/penicillin-binding protein 2
MNLWIAFALLGAATLYEQSAARILRARFASTSLSYVAADAATGRIIAADWQDPQLAIPIGSLVKPFLAAALDRNVWHRCRADRCWLPAGHGQIGVKDAIAHSCNSYFLEAASRIDTPRFAGVLEHFGLPAADDASAETRIGLGRRWRISPVSLLAAWRLLVSEQGREEIRAGLRLAAAEGTAHLLGVDAMAKTGTAPCTHSRHGLGDGFVIAAWPAVRPRYLLLVRAHNRTGAQTARTGGEILRALRDGR